MRSILNLILLGTLIFFVKAKSANSQGVIMPDGSYVPPLKLSNFYPDFDNFEGEIKYFEWKSLRQPDDQFLKPDIEKWISTLKKIEKPGRKREHIKVWFKDNKARFFYLYPVKPSYRYFFAVNGDTIDFTTVGEDNTVGVTISQIGVGFWRYFYKDGRLRARKSYLTEADIYGKKEFINRLAGVENYIYFDEDKEAYLYSTEYKNKYGITVWNKHIDKKRFDYSISGGRIWYDGW